MADNQLQYMLIMNTDEFVAAAKKASEAFEDAMNPKPAEDLDDQIDKTSKGFGGMEGALKKLGGILVATFAVDKIKDFFVEAVQSAATVKATTAQFEQVFGDNAKVVQEKLNEMGASMGILPERLKPGMSKLSSMFMGLGVDSTKATDMASRGMTASADAAAFYDKSLEEAQSNLTSFIKGNYEGGESIGLFANATQIADWSTKNLHKDFTKMTEAEKQETRLKFAEEMMKKSGAMGQASREADGLENQMGNLKQAWETFTAKIGAPILEKVVIPAIMGIVSVLDTLGQSMGTMDMSAFIEFGEGIKTIAQDMWDKISEGIEAIKPIFEQMTPLLKPLLDALLVIADVAGNVLATAFQVLAPFVAVVVKALSAMIKPVLECIPLLKPLADYIISIFGEKVSAMFPVFQAGVEYIAAAFVFLVEVVKDVVKFFNTLGQAISQFVHGDATGAWDTLKQGFSNLCSGLKDTISTFGKEMLIKYANFFTEILKYLGDVLKNIIPLIWNTLVQTVELLVKLYQMWMDLLFKVWSEIGAFILEKLVEISKVIGEKVFEMITSTVAYLTELRDNITNKFIEIATAIGNKVLEIKNNVVNKFNEIKNGIVNKVNEIKTNTVNKFTEMKNAVVNKIIEMSTNTVNKVKEMPKKFTDAFKNLTTSMTNIGKNAIQGLLSGLTNAWKSVSNWVSEKATWVANKFKEILKIQSPSRAFIEIGEFIDLGLVKGLENEEDRIDNKVINIARSIPNTFARLTDTDFSPNLNAVNTSSSRTIVRNQSVPIVQLIVEGDIGAVVDKVSSKIVRQTGLMVGGRV